jgi:hypothetical protein
LILVGLFGVPKVAFVACGPENACHAGQVADGAPGAFLPGKPLLELATEMSHDLRKLIIIPLEGSLLAAPLSG